MFVSRRVFLLLLGKINSSPSKIYWWLEKDPFLFRFQSLFRGYGYVQLQVCSTKLLPRQPGFFRPTKSPFFTFTKKPSPEGCTPQTTPLPSWQLKPNALPSRRNSPVFFWGEFAWSGHPKQQRNIIKNNLNLTAFLLHNYLLL